PPSRDPDELPRAAKGSVPDLELPSAAVAVETPILDTLPELPKWEPPPPSPPPPRYDAGSWEPPVYKPALISDSPEDGAESLPTLEESVDSLPTLDDPSPSEAPSIPLPAAPASKAPSIPAPAAESTSRAPSPPPSLTPRESAAKLSARTARVATRVSGSGATGLAIGIDLGTSNTCASSMIDGQPQVIPTRFGTNTVPSVLTVIDSRVVVGHAAAKRMIMNPHETIYGSKRLVGRAYTEELADEYQPSFAYPLVETEDHRFGASLRGRVISFEQVAEYLLAEVRDVAEGHLGERVHRAVITVPAYFGEAQRDAVRRAARGARLSVDRLVPEPTAAAIAYGYDAQKAHTLVVFDLGGGTFDVSVLKVGGNRFEVLATGGDAFLGGIDVDDLIAGYLLEEFQRVERTTLEPTPQQLARLRDAAEEAKRDLSMQARVAIHLPHFAHIDDAPRELRATVDREKLDELASGFVDRLIAITAATLADCRMTPHDVDDILLVGGMTRMALIPERVQEYFGRRPSKRINPDEAVALGAARLAASGGSVELLDVLPLSIGVAGQGRRFQRLLPRNTSVPMERSFTLRTRFEDQNEYRLPLFQGEREDAAANEYLGTLMLEEIPPGPAGAELELLFSLDEQCYLEVRAAHVASGRGLAVYINREEGAEKAIERLESYSGPKQESKKTPRRGLGRFFGKLRSLFGRK
ncbi:MAG: Hsp70 family protein, partial [Myxococcota bacterium]